MTLSLEEHIPLAPFTTLGVGGPARYFIHAHTEKTVHEAVDFAKRKGLPLLVMGGGSNMLIADAGFSGVVLRVEVMGTEWADDGNTVRLVAGAGEDWDQTVASCVGRGLYGVECLSGIPGTVGGTPVQNVGAYGQEVSETLVKVLAFDRVEDKEVELSHRNCRFSYRTSIFNSTELNRYIVLRVAYEFSKSGVPCIRYPDLKREFTNKAEPTLAEVREAVVRIRASKGMVLDPDDIDTRSAGSFFKNPIVTPDVCVRVEAIAGEPAPRYPASDGNVKLSAAWLIERAGIARGYRRGNAAISSKHTLALTNRGGTTAAELIALADEVRSRVEDRFGVSLLMEPVLVGFEEEN